MSKKDYEAIARIIAYALSARQTAVPSFIAYRMAEYFALNNPRFKRAKFLEACGVQRD